MKIEGKRIRSLKFLEKIEELEKKKIGVMIKSEQVPKELKKSGTGKFRPDIKWGIASRRNTVGEYKINKELPKINKYINTIEWHWKQYHGRDLEDMYDFVDIYRNVYQKDFIEPLEVDFIFIQEKNLIYADLELKEIDKNKDKILIAINILLEKIGYCENLDEFDRTYENINDNLVNYEYENVLNGNTSTFGVELEFVGGNADAIARELYDLGITAAPYRLGYHARVSDNTKWKLERDSSVSSGSQGGEIVSPILKDTPETWRQIEVICEVAKRHGARVNQSCGGHVHIGMQKLDTARQRWRRFFKMIENYEECLYRAAGGDLGRIRSNASHYAINFNQRASMANRMAFRMDNEEDVRAMAERVSNMNRYYGINLKNIATDRAPTVEFRYFNGSLNPKQIQANIKLAAGIINASEKSRWRDTDDENYKKRGQILKNANTSVGTRTKEKIIELLDIAFSRKKDKDMILNVLKKNEWR